MDEAHAIVDNWIKKIFSLHNFSSRFFKILNSARNGDKATKKVLRIGPVIL